MSQRLLKDDFMCLIVYMCTVYVQVQAEFRRGLGSPGTGIIGSFEPSDGCSGNQSLGPLQEH